MNSPPKRRWLPRFGLRSMFIVVLLVALYFGSWPWLEKRAHYDIKAASQQRFRGDFEEAVPPGIVFDDYLASIWFNPVTVAPYIVGVDEAQRNDRGATRDVISGWRRRYYAWLFGQPVRLPITSPVDDYESLVVE